MKKLVKDFLIYGLSSSIGKFVGFFLVPIYTRAFTPEDFGILDIISTVTFFFALVGMMQIESAVARYYYTFNNSEEKKKFISTAVTSIMILSGIIVIFSTLFSPILSKLLFKDTGYGLIIIIAVIHIPLSNLAALFGILLRYRKEPVIYTIIHTLQILTIAGITIWLVVFKKIGILGVFIGQLSGFFIISMIMVYYLKKEYCIFFSLKSFKKIIRYSAPLVPATTGTWMNKSINRFVMLAYLSLGDIGLYAVAMKLASIISILASALKMAWLPFFWETLESADHKRIIKIFHLYVSIGFFILVIFATLLSGPLIKLLTTPAYYSASRLVGILVFAIGLSEIIYQIVGLGPAITKRTEFNTIIYFTSSAINISLLFLLVPKYGLIAVPVCLLVANSVHVLLGWINSERLYFMGFNKSVFVFAYSFTLLFTIFYLLIVNN